MPGGSSWPCVWLGAAPPLQGDLGTPAGAQADVPSCEERVQRRFSALGETVIKWDLVFSEVSIRALGLQVGGCAEEAIFSSLESSWSGGYLRVAEDDVGSLGRVHGTGEGWLQGTGQSGRGAQVGEDRTVGGLETPPPGSPSNHFPTNR